MSNNDAVETDVTSVPALATEKRAVEIPNAAPVKLQTLDLARHVAVAPDGRRYVVATYDDSRLGRDVVTAVFPQQNGYLTLVRLEVCEFHTPDPDEAIQRHIAVVQAIQQGKLKQYLKANQ